MPFAPILLGCTKQLNMEELEHLTLAELFELLNEHTVRYSHFLRSGAADDEYESCRTSLKHIQAEIKFRKAYDPTNKMNNPLFSE